MQLRKLISSLSKNALLHFLFYNLKVQIKCGFSVFWCLSCISRKIITMSTWKIVE